MKNFWYDFVKVCFYESVQFVKLLWQNVVKFFQFLYRYSVTSAKFGNSSEIAPLNHQKLSGNLLLRNSCLIYGRHMKFCTILLNYTKLHETQRRESLFITPCSHAVRTYYDEVVLSSDLCGLPRPLLRISDDGMIFSHQSYAQKNLKGTGSRVRILIF